MRIMADLLRQGLLNAAAILQVGEWIEHGHPLETLGRGLELACHRLAIRRAAHKTLKRVGESIERLSFNSLYLGLNPVAYTYDWGMVTDLARRNVSRICGKLGIEHALIGEEEKAGGMFQRFPIFERLISWTKPEAPSEPGTRDYELYDHNSLIADEREAQACCAGLMDRSYDVPSRAEMEAELWRDELVAGRDDLRPVAEEALHVTLAFLGYRAEQEAAAIAEAMASGARDAPLQTEEALLGGKTTGEARGAPVRAHHAVTGRDDREGIAPIGSADGAPIPVVVPGGAEGGGGGGSGGDVITTATTGSGGASGGAAVGRMPIAATPLRAPRRARRRACPRPSARLRAFRQD